MKNTLVNLAILGATVTALTFSAHSEAKRGGNKKSPEVKFQRIDADQSGGIILDELLANLDAKAEKKFSKLDSDSSASVSLDEYLASKRNQTDLSIYADDIVQCVQDEKDASGDTNIVVPSADDFVSPSDKFDALDSDDDAALSLTEVQAAYTTKKTEQFNTMDADNSGDISLEEFTSALETKSATRKAVKSCIDEVVDAIETV